MSPPNSSNAKLTSGFSHVGLSVSDLDASFQFFQALGFDKVGGVDSYPSIFLSDGSSLLTLWQTEKGPTLTHAMVYEPSGNRIELTHHQE